MKINKKLVIALTVLTLVLTLGTTAAFASNNGDKAANPSTQTGATLNLDKSGNVISADPTVSEASITVEGSAQLNLDKSGNVIDANGNIVVTKDKLSASGQDQATLIIATNPTASEAPITSGGSAQLNLDKSGNVIDANGNIIVTKDKLSANGQDQATLIIAADQRP